MDEIVSDIEHRPAALVMGNHPIVRWKCLSLLADKIVTRNPATALFILCPDKTTLKEAMLNRSRSEHKDQWNVCQVHTLFGSDKEFQGDESDITELFRSVGKTFQKTDQSLRDAKYPFLSALASCSENNHPLHFILADAHKFRLSILYRASQLMTLMFNMGFLGGCPYTCVLETIDGTSREDEWLITTDSMGNLNPVMCGTRPHFIRLDGNETLANASVCAKTKSIIAAAVANDVNLMSTLVDAKGGQITLSTMDRMRQIFKVDADQYGDNSRLSIAVCFKSIDIVSKLPKAMKLPYTVIAAKVVTSVDKSRLKDEQAKDYCLSNGLHMYQKVALIKGGLVKLTQDVEDWHEGDVGRIKSMKTMANGCEVTLEDPTGTRDTAVISPVLVHTSDDRAIEVHQIPLRSIQVLSHLWIRSELSNIHTVFLCGSLSSVPPSDLVRVLKFLKTASKIRYVSC